MPAPDLDADAAAFEEWRPLLFGIAYRMLGSAADAEDVVQDASIRWLRRSDHVVESVRAYVVTIVTRLCLDQLDSARSRRLTYAGPWLPEPVVVEEEDAAEQADSLSLAFLVLLEELTPLERFRQSEQIFAQYLALGGSLDPDPDPTSPFYDPETSGTGAAYGRPGLRVLRRGPV